MEINLIVAQMSSNNVKDMGPIFKFDHGYWMTDQIATVGLVTMTIEIWRGALDRLRNRPEESIMFPY